MQVLPILIAIVLGILALAFVLYPLYKRTPAPKSGVGQGDQGEVLPLSWANKRTNPVDSHESQAESTLTDREQAARTALQEIELDYQLGNIAESDYRTLRERYVRRALVALKSRYDREQELDEMIETKLQKLKEHDGDGER
jgi:hypothetical protein